MSLILYTLCPVQEPMIYLEDKGGMIRDYSISVIIDNSKSCFIDINENHSYLTIINLLRIIYTMAIPSFDLIITRGYNEEPQILLFDKPSIKIFKDDSIFEKLLILLSNPLFKTDLSKAIETSFNLKKKKKYEKESYLFILTDGLMHKKKEEDINNYLNQCQLIGMRTFGIGLGRFPCKAKELFETFIYSVNPDNLLKTISFLFGKNIKTENELQNLSKYNNLDIKELQKIFEELENNENFLYKNLREELKKIKQGDDILNLFCNKEKKNI